jgi:hypothetical protein
LHAQTAIAEFCSQAGMAWSMSNAEPSDDLVARAQSTLYHTFQHIRPQTICSTFIIHSGDLLALYETTREVGPDMVRPILRSSGPLIAVVDCQQHIQKALLLDSNRAYAHLSGIMEQCEPHTSELEIVTGFLRLENTWSKGKHGHATARLRCPIAVV